MFYWLFTEGRAALVGLMWPLACSSVVIPILVATLLGVGIQRRADGTPLKTTGVISVGRLLSFIVPSLGVIALYTNLLSGITITRSVDRQTPFLVDGRAFLCERIALDDIGVWSGVPAVLLEHRHLAGDSQWRLAA
jgi:hypothetical protein